MSKQLATIQQGLAHLNTIGITSGFDLSNPRDEFKAFIFILKNRKILKDAGIPYIGVFRFERKYKIEHRDNGYIFEDLSSGVTRHIRETNGTLTCDCDGFHQSGTCYHLDRIAAD